MSDETRSNVWRISHAVVTLAPVQEIDLDHGNVGAGNPEQQMVSGIAAVQRLDRAHLQLIPNDSTAPITETDPPIEKVSTPPHRTPVVMGEPTEHEDWAGVGVTLFRYVSTLGEPMTAHLPTRRLTPKVRARLYELLMAIEEAGLRVTALVLVLNGMLA